MTENRSVVLAAEIADNTILIVECSSIMPRYRGVFAFALMTLAMVFSKTRTAIMVREAAGGSRQSDECMPFGGTL